MGTATQAEFQVASEVCASHEPGFYYANYQHEPNVETIIEIDASRKLLWARNPFACLYRWRIIGPVPTSSELFDGQESEALE